MKKNIAISCRPQPTETTESLVWEAAKDTEE